MNTYFLIGRSIVHGRHQLPYWTDRNNKQVRVHHLENGNEVELPQYTVRPFLMKNTEGTYRTLPDINQYLSPTSLRRYTRFNMTK